MSPDGSHVSTKAATENAASEPMSLERKLELLEPRFTSPSLAANATSGFENTFALAQSPNGSRHSFSFEQPQGSRSSMFSSSASNASNLPPSVVRSKRRSSLKQKTSFHAVSLAAERQIRKVQTSPTFILAQHDPERSMSALASPPMSNASASNSTLITSHVNSSQPQVVAESPPTLTSPFGQAAAPPPPEKPKAARNVLGTSVSLDYECSCTHQSYN